MRKLNLVALTLALAGCGVDIDPRKRSRGPSNASTAVVRKDFAYGVGGGGLKQIILRQGISKAESLPGPPGTNELFSYMQKAQFTQTVLLPVGTGGADPEGNDALVRAHFGGEPKTQNEVYDPFAFKIGPESFPDSKALFRCAQPIINQMFVHARDTFDAPIIQQAVMTTASFFLDVNPTCMNPRTMGFISSVKNERFPDPLFLCELKPLMTEPVFYDWRHKGVNLYKLQSSFRVASVEPCERLEGALPSAAFDQSRYPGVYTAARSGRLRPVTTGILGYVFATTLAGRYAPPATEAELQKACSDYLGTCTAGELAEYRGKRLADVRDRMASSPHSIANIQQAVLAHLGRPVAHYGELLAYLSKVREGGMKAAIAGICTSDEALRFAYGDVLLRPVGTAERAHWRARIADPAFDCGEIKSAVEKLRSGQVAAIMAAQRLILAP